MPRPPHFLLDRLQPSDLPHDAKEVLLVQAAAPFGAVSSALRRRRCRPASAARVAGAVRAPLVHWGVQERDVQRDVDWELARLLRGVHSAVGLTTWTSPAPTRRSGGDASIVPSLRALRRPPAPWSPCRPRKMESCRRPLLSQWSLKRFSASCLRIVHLQKRTLTRNLHYDIKRGPRWREIKNENRERDGSFSGALYKDTSLELQHNEWLFCYRVELGHGTFAGTRAPFAGLATGTIALPGAP